MEHIDFERVFFSKISRNFRQLHADNYNKKQLEVIMCADPVRDLIGRNGVPIEYRSLPEDLRKGLRELGVNELSLPPTHVKIITQSNERQKLSGQQVAISFSNAADEYLVVVDATNNLATVLKANMVRGEALQQIANIKSSPKDVLAIILASDKTKNVILPKALNPKTLEDAKKQILSKNQCASSSDLIDCGLEKMRVGLEEKEREERYKSLGNIPDYF